MATESRNLNDFRGAFDREEQVRGRLREVLGKLLKAGKEEWRSEREICVLARVSTKDIPEFRSEFAAHTVSVPSRNRMKSKTIWFASPQVAAKVRT